jgi:CRP/FNR family cyclic AMP-dependent transcriptional regulator
MSDKAGYDPRIALEFFKAVGKPEKFAAGETIFSEKEKGVLKKKHIYLVLTGEVALSARKKPLGTVKAGGIFGELAAITGAARTAAATAKTDCKVISLEDKAFQSSLRRKPAFALMLMSVMIARLREAIAALGAAGELGEKAMLKESSAFDPKHVPALVSGLSDEPVVYYDRNKPILQAGQAGLRMYIVTEGRVAVQIGERTVERLGPGGVFGEAALVDKTPRLASVVAETDCALLPVTRNGFIGLVKMSPGFAEKMLASLAERLRFLTARLP